MGFSEDAQKAPAPSNDSSNPKLQGSSRRLGTVPVGGRQQALLHACQPHDPFPVPFFHIPRPEAAEPHRDSRKLMLLPMLVLKGHL